MPTGGATNTPSAPVSLRGPRGAGPRRIQLRRTKGFRKPKHAIVVSRPSKWGNPYKPGELDVDGVTPMSPARAVERYRTHLALGHFKRAEFEELRGKDLACWCPLPKPGEPDVCHAAVLIAIANDGDGNAR